MRALPEPLPSSRSGSARRTASLVLSLLLACGALASCRGETPSAPVKGEAPRLVFSLHRLNLDGVGSIDDRAAVFIRGGRLHHRGGAAGHRGRALLDL